MSEWKQVSIKLSPYREAVKNWTNNQGKSLCCGLFGLSGYMHHESCEADSDSQVRDAFERCIEVDQRAKKIDLR